MYNKVGIRMEMYAIEYHAISRYMRPWRSTYRTRRWMSAEKSYQQGRCSERKSRTGWAGKRYKPHPGSSRLSRNRKLDRGCQHLGRSRETSVPVDSRNRHQSTPTALFFLSLFLFLLPFRVTGYHFPWTLLTLGSLGETPLGAEKNLRFLKRIFWLESALN